MAEFKPKPLASVSWVSTGLNSLAASTTRLAGYETNAIDCTGGTGAPWAGVLVSGKFTAAAANHNAGQIDVWAIGAANDTPTWPDVFDGVASAETVTSQNVLNGHARLVKSITGDSVNDRVYWFGPIDLAALFDGVLPDQIVLFITHNIHSTTSAWAASGHEIWYTPYTFQSV